MSDECTEVDVLGRIYSEVLSIKDRISNIELEMRDIRANLHILVNSYRNHQKRLGILESSTPIPIDRDNGG